MGGAGAHCGASSGAAPFRSPSAPSCTGSGHRLPSLYGSSAARPKAWTSGARCGGGAGVPCAGSACRQGRSPKHGKRELNRMVVRCRGTGGPRRGQAGCARSSNLAGSPHDRLMATTQPAWERSVTMSRIAQVHDLLIIHHAVYLSGRLLLRGAMDAYRGATSSVYRPFSGVRSWRAA